MDEQLWAQIQTFGLGGVGWMLFIATANALNKVQEKYTGLLLKQRDEAIERARLLEQRLFDLKASMSVVE